MAKEMRDLWPKVLERIKPQVSPQQFQTWFAHIRPVPGKGDREIELRVPNEYYREWLTRSYKGLLEETLSAVSGVSNVHFTVEEDLPGILSADPCCSLNKGYSFENFVVGASNRLAHAAAVAVAESPGKTYNPLFLHGGVGLGKTHLLHAICFSLLDNNPVLRVLFLPCESFVNHFIATVKSGRWEAFRKTYRDVDVLVMDDVHFLARSPRSREEFFHTFNSLFNSQKQLVFSSDRPPEDMPDMEERLVSRFKWGLSTKIERPELETRIAIVEKKAALLNIRIPPEAARTIAEYVSGSIREIEGAVIRFSRYASLDRTSHPAELAMSVASEVTSGGLRPVSIEKILSAVASNFNVSLAQLQSRQRTRSVATARQVAMYLSRRLTSLSLQEIGGYLGGRDHSTVVHAEGKIKAAKERDEALSRLIDKIERKLQGGSG